MLRRTEASPGQAKGRRERETAGGVHHCGSAAAQIHDVPQVLKDSGDVGCAGGVYAALVRRQLQQPSRPGVSRNPSLGSVTEEEAMRSTKPRMSRQDTGAIVDEVTCIASVDRLNRASKKPGCTRWAPGC